MQILIEELFSAISEAMGAVIISFRDFQTIQNGGEHVELANQVAEDDPAVAGHSASCQQIGDGTGIRTGREITGRN
jgi:hypothetical protein